MTEASSNSKDLFEQQLQAFLQQLGHRVLAARQQRGLSRRQLSELSGVSQRTIVLLETAAGNISVALLFKLAQALGHTPQWFIQGDSGHEEKVQRVAEYFRVAGIVEQQQVLNLVASADRRRRKCQRLCLIGLRGAGKSTLGAELSKALSLPFVELNREIEYFSGLSVQELISLYGQEGYRRLERQALEKIVDSRDRLVLAAAGGIVAEPGTYATLLEHFHTIWLKASPQEHMDRVREQGDERPMAGNPQAMHDLKSILTSRETLYAAADVHIDTSAKSLDSTLDELLQCATALLSEAR